MHDESQKSITQIRDIIEDEKKRRTVPSKVKYIRIKEATEIFQIKKTKLSQMARDAGAAYKINGVLLIDPEKLDLYIQSFAVPSLTRW